MASQFDNYSKKKDKSSHGHLHLLRNGGNDSSHSGDLSDQELEEAATSAYIWQVRITEPTALNRPQCKTGATLVRVPIAELPALNGLLYDAFKRQRESLSRIAELEQLVEKDLDNSREVNALRKTVTDLRATISERNTTINKLERERWEREESDLACRERGRTGLRRLWENISTVMIRMKSPKGAERS